MQRRIESIADGKLQKNRGCEKETKFHIRFDTYRHLMKTRVTIVNVVIFCRTTISTEISHDVQGANSGKSETLVTCK